MSHGIDKTVHQEALDEILAQDFETSTINRDSEPMEVWTDPGNTAENNQDKINNK